MLVSSLFQINMKTSTWFVWQYLIQYIEGENEQRIIIGFVDSWQCESVCLTWARTWVQSPASKPEGTREGGAGREKENVNLISHGNFNLLLKWLNVSEICHSDKETWFRRGRGWRQWTAEMTFHVCLLLHVSELWGLI